jgi:YD repeat-containing protein
MDRETLAVGPRTAAQGGPVKTKTEYDSAGRVTRVTKPKGVDSAPANDYVTETAYDLLDRELTVTQHATESGASRVTNYCYDDAGDLRSVTGPKGAASFTSCPNPAAEPYVYTAATHTTKFEYDDAHRQIKATDPLGRTTQTTYDENGEVTTETDETNKVTQTFYDARGDQAKLVEPFDTGRTLTTLWEYDPLGNVKRLISPRAFDAAGGQAPYTDFVESYSYDALNRVVTTKLPTGQGANTYFADVLAAGPTVYWRFGASGIDEVGTPANATVYGQVGQPGALPGDPDGALACGGGGICALANNGELNPWNSMTVEAWVKTTSTANQTIFGHSNHGVRLWTSGGGFGLNWTVTGGSGNAEGNWHHVVAVFEEWADTIKIYVDGVLRGSFTDPEEPWDGKIYYTTSEVTIGGSWGGNYFTGSLDEVAVYWGALNASQVAAHYAARNPAPTPQAYTHQAYDANGQTLWTSLPTTAATPGAVTAQEKTQLAYWDTGAIYSSQEPASPKVRFDYTAEGWQASRTAELKTQPGTLDLLHAMYWEYLPDGLLRAHVDQESARALYAYDQNGNRVQALEATGIVAPGQSVLQIDLTHNSLDELQKVRTPKPGAPGTYLATTLAYDLHGNTVELVDNREENGGGTQTAAGRVFTYGYDAADQATSQLDDFATTATTWPRG